MIYYDIYLTYDVFKRFEKEAIKGDILYWEHNKIIHKILITAIMGIEKMNNDVYKIHKLRFEVLDDL